MPRPDKTKMVELRVRYGKDSKPKEPPIRMCCMNLPFSVAETLALFIEGAAVFGLSRTWYDLVAAYILGLQPVPFCGTPYHPDPCEPVGSAWDQTIFALISIPVLGTIKFLAEDVCKCTHWGGMWDDIPMISNFIIGWAFANALSKAVAELKDSYPVICEVGSLTTGGDCIGFDAVFAVFLTIALGLIIIMIQPLVLKIELGELMGADGELTCAGKCLNGAAHTPPPLRSSRLHSCRARPTHGSPRCRSRARQPSRIFSRTWWR